MVVFGLWRQGHSGGGNQSAFNIDEHLPVLDNA